VLRISCMLYRTAGLL